jgi:cysteine desulfurase
MKPIYLDYAATTPVDPRVVEKMLALLGPDATFGNPASRSHLYGWLAEEAVENARRQIADLLGADPREIVFTSGATESNNLAIKGVATNHPRGHIVTSAIEHKAVLDPCHWLQTQGHEVTVVPPLTDGRADLNAILAALRADTCLVSVMHANNETGVINDITTLADACHQRGIIFHTDAAQSAGKLPLDMSLLKADLISVSAHKLYGPKGMGVLYVRRRPGLELAPLIHGGGHERGLRSGTLASHQIVGMGEACALAAQERETDNTRIASLRERLWQGLSEALDDIRLNGVGAERLPGHLNVAFAGVKGDLLLGALGQLAVSTGSACNSASMAPSYVLKAMGLSDALAHASLRFSLGRFTTAAEVDAAIEQVVTVVKRLRS